MGVSIQQWRARIGCNKYLSGKNLNFTLHSPLISPTSSARSRYASSLAALILFLALLSSHTSSQLTKNNCTRINSTCLANQDSHPWSYRVPQSDFSMINRRQQSGAWLHISSTQRNQLVRASNGNRDARGIRLAHWNPGSAHLPNKMTQLELAVADHQPHLLGVSEANFRRDHDLEEVQRLKVTGPPSP